MDEDKSRSAFNTGGGSYDSILGASSNTSADSSQETSVSTEDSGGAGRLIVKKGKRNKKRAAIIGGSVAGVAAVALIATAALNPTIFGGGDQDNRGLTDTVNSAPGDANSGDKKGKDGEKVEPDEVSNDTFYQKEGKLFPIKTDKWEQSSYNSQKGKDADSLRDAVLAKNSDQGFSTDSNVLPMEEAGFTSDDSKVTLPDGTLNGMYSYWTKELFDFQLGNSVERLLNPVYGDWSRYQRANTVGNIDFSKFDDMFTDEFADQVSSDPRNNLPIYADWDSNDYGMGDQLLNGGTRWIGSVKSSKIDMKFDQESGQYTAYFSADVTFTAWTKNESKVMKSGTLNMTLVANNGKYADKGKVLISEATLKVG